MSSDCYVVTSGEVVVLQGLSSNEYNGAVATVEGVREQRVAVRLLHSSKQILVKPEHLLEGGGTGDSGAGEGSHDVDDSCDYDDDGCPINDDSSAAHEKPLDASTGAEIMDQEFTSLIDDNLVIAFELLTAAPPKSCNNISVLSEGFRCCHSAIERNPDNWVAYEVLGELFLNIEDDVQAADAFDMQFHILSKIHPVCHQAALVALFTKVLLRVANIRGRMRDSARELEALLNVLMIDSRSIQVLVMVGYHYLDSENINTAIQYFKDAIAVDESWAFGRLHLARALLQNGQPHDALSALQIAVNDCATKRDDETVEKAAKSYLMIADMAESVGPSQTGHLIIIKALLRAINLIQQSSVTERTENSKLAAFVYLKLGKHLESRGASETLSNTTPSIQSSGFHDGAISSYKKACELDGDDSSHKLALGNALRIRAHSRKSKEDLDDSIVVYKSGLLLDSGELTATSPALNLKDDIFTLKIVMYRMKSSEINIPSHCHFRKLGFA